MASRLRWRFSDLRIGAKIGILLLTAAAPFALMTVLFLAQASKDIASARQELRGVDHLQQLNPVLASLSQQSGGGLDAALLDRVRQQSQADDTLVPSGAAVGAFLDAASRPDRLLALEAAKSAFQKIADSSLLTLDPALDSSDLVDVVVARAPELVVSSVGLRRALAYYVRNGRADLPEFGELIAGLNRFGRAREAIQASLLPAVERSAARADPSEFKTAVERLLGLAHRLSSMAGNAQGAIESEVPVRGAADLIALSDQVITDSFGVSALAQTELALLLTKRVAALESDMRFKLAIVVGLFVLAILLGVLILRSIQGPVAQLTVAIRHFQAGDFDTVVPHADSRSELGEIARALKQFQSMGAHQALTTAIEASTTMLMITDPAGAVAFMSRGLREMLGTLEPILRAGDADFTAERLVGMPMEQLLANARLRPILVQGDGEAQTMRYEIGGRTLHVATSTIRNGAGAVIAQTAHWQDVTAELAAEREIAVVVGTASRGDFDAELDTAGKTGAALDIAQGLNQISATVRNAALDFVGALNAIAHGDLTRRIDATMAVSSAAWATPSTRPVKSWRRRSARSRARPAVPP